MPSTEFLSYCSRRTCQAEGAVQSRVLCDPKTVRSTQLKYGWLSSLSGEMNDWKEVIFFLERWTIFSNTKWLVNEIFFFKEWRSSGGFSSTVGFLGCFQVTFIEWLVIEIVIYFYLPGLVCPFSTPIFMLLSVEGKEVMVICENVMVQNGKTDQSTESIVLRSKILDWILTSTSVSTFHTRARSASSIHSCNYSLVKKKKKKGPFERK